MDTGKKQGFLLPLFCAVCLLAAMSGTLLWRMNAARTPRFRVTVAKETVSVFTDCGAGRTLSVSLGRRGPNGIFDFTGFTLTKKHLFGEDRRLLEHVCCTDSLSPYIVYALGGIDGDLPDSSDFTGGNHNYLNIDWGSTATGRTAWIAVFADGKPVTDFDGYAARLDLCFDNYVQATNTKKENGTGREVLCESYHLTFDGQTWAVNCRVTALEPICIETYYGIEADMKGISDTVTFLPLHESAAWNTGVYSAEAAEAVRCTGGALNVETAVIASVRNEAYTAAPTFHAFSTVYGKVYYDLAPKDRPIMLDTGEAFVYWGTYRFEAGR